jgi:anti-sigma B factor antagonist
MSEPNPQAPAGAETLIGTVFGVEVLELVPGIRGIAVTGDVDLATAPSLGEAISRELAVTSRRLILDLTRVSFLGSTALFVLVQARDTALQANVELRLVCNAPVVLRPLQLTGLDKLFAISETLADAADPQR